MAEKKQSKKKEDQLQLLQKQQKVKVFLSWRIKLDGMVKLQMKKNTILQWKI